MGRRQVRKVTRVGQARGLERHSFVISEEGEFRTEFAHKGRGWRKHCFRGYWILAFGKVMNTAKCCQNGTRWCCRE